MATEGEFDLYKWAYERAQERAYHDETDLKDTLVEGFLKALELVKQEVIRQDCKKVYEVLQIINKLKNKDPK